MSGPELDSVRRPLSVVVAGGGTGGHLFPGIAVAGVFVRRNPKSRVLFVGAGRPLEKEALARAGFVQQVIDIEGIKGRGLWSKIRAAVKIPGAVWRSAAILRKAKADLVVGLGGYSAGPVGLAAWLGGIPLVLCEQNNIPGVTNRMLIPLAKRIYVSFDDTRGTVGLPKKRFTGNPVRQQILDACNEPVKSREGFTVLVVGGSQGAHAINQAVVEALPHLNQMAAMRFMHQTGETDQAHVAAAYRAAGIDAEVKAFFHDMAGRYREADLVVCRAGATTVAELTAMGKAALFIPFPFATDNHQEHNARSLVEQDAAMMMLERDLSGPSLAGQLDALSAAPDRLAEMAARSRRLGKPDAAQAIVEDCYQLLGCDPCI